MECCRFCYKATAAGVIYVLPGENEGSNHLVCMKKYMKLIKNGICTKCGEKKAVKKMARHLGVETEIIIWCIDCDKRSRHTCYEGPELHL